MNDNWEQDADGNCQPDPDKFVINCNGDGITVKMSKEVVPATEDVTLLGDCAGVLDLDR